MHIHDWLFSLVLFFLCQECMGFNLDVPIDKLIVAAGYKLEEHWVETEDGYILKVFRFYSQDNGTHMRPAFMVHGLLGSAENWVTLGPKKALGFLFAERGYDVWLLNVRGTFHSRKHRSLSPNSKEYWMFNIHELGFYDLPATLDYIMNVTNKTGLLYFGHSQGCAIFSIMASERPKYQPHIRLAILLAPAVYLGHIRQPLLRSMVQQAKTIQNLADSMGVYEMLPFGLNSVLTNVCVTNTQLCKNFMMIIDGNFDIDDDVVKAALRHFPAGASSGQIFHFGQNVASDDFRKYDFGPVENLKLYNQTTPPAYKLKEIRIPVVLFYSAGDPLVVNVDVQRLSRTLPNVVASIEVSKEVTHLGFVLHKNIVALVYDKLLEIVRKFEEK